MTPSPTKSRTWPYAVCPDPADAKPRRIQLSRVKGWRMPPNTVKVDRSTRYGNPLLCTPHGCQLKPCGCCDPFRCCVTVFRNWVLYRHDPGSLTLGVDALLGHPNHTRLVGGLPALRGKNLACWCALTKNGEYVPCHADVLLSLANDIPLEDVIRENIRRAKGEAVR